MLLIHFQFPAYILLSIQFNNGISLSFHFSLYPGVCDDEAPEEPAISREKRSETLQFDGKQYIRLPLQRRVSPKFVHSFVGKRASAAPAYQKSSPELDPAAAKQAVEELAVRRLLLSQNSGNDDLGIAESLALAGIIGRRLSELSEAVDNDDQQDSPGITDEAPALQRRSMPSFAERQYLIQNGIPLRMVSRRLPSFSHNFVGKRADELEDFNDFQEQSAGGLRFGDFMPSDNEEELDYKRQAFNHAFVGKRQGFDHAFVGKRQGFDHAFVGKRQGFDHAFVGKRQGFDHAFVGKRQGFDHAFVGKRQAFGSRVCWQKTGV